MIVCYTCKKDIKECKWRILTRYLPHKKTWYINFSQDGYTSLSDKLSSDRWLCDEGCFQKMIAKQEIRNGNDNQ